LSDVNAFSYAAELVDRALQEEIELVAELVVAAAGTCGRLSNCEIDAALGAR
jgi:hypothetical protein